MNTRGCDEEEIRELLHHAGGMVLWQTVECWDQQQLRCSTRTHLDPGNPLRRDGALAAIHLGEYGAQLMAIHGALMAREKHSGILAPGVLASLRDFHMRRPRIDDIASPLTGTVRALIVAPSGSIYEFEIRAGEQPLASGRVSVVTTPDAAVSG